MVKLHPQQIALLELLRNSIDNPMSVREIQDELRMSSPSVVQHHIQQLEKKGYLKRNPSNPRDYRILADPEKPVSYLNLYGMAQCGQDGKFLDGNPLERIPVALRLLRFPASEAFLVEAKGDSMIPRIHEGDLVIIQHKNIAEDGDTVLCVNKEMVLIKRIKRTGERILLISDNKDNYDPFIADEDFAIVGVVRGIMKYN
jgi:repressor LexA